MDIGASAAPISTKSVKLLENVRRSVTYHPSVWGDFFLAYTSDFGECPSPEETHLQRQKEEVKHLLETTSNDSLRKLELIDAVQRLGLAYQFETEIQKSLDCMYKTYLTCNLGEDDDDLFTVALRFRLLRQQGYHISCDVFKKFKNHEGKFDGSLVNNVEGLLSLYEAAHFGINGEEILDEALEFCTTNLEAIVQNTGNPSLAARIDDALKHPIHKTLKMLEIKKFVSIYQEHESHDELLLRFAKLQFNKLQKMYQKELSEITRWWKGLDFEKKLPFARDRLVECYFWVLGIYFEPQFRFGRILLSKLISMASVIDDIYDVEGTLDELQLFTDAIQRWNVSVSSELLPQYMRHCYQALLDVYAEAEEELGKIGRSYFVQYAIDDMKKMVRAYFEEAKCLFHNHIPSSMEEYMKVAIPSSGYTMVATTSVVGMGILVRKEELDWVSSEPLLVRASATIARLMDDMVGHQSEQKSSAVESYMKEYGASKDEAFRELERLVWKAWKDINEECLHPPNHIAVPILTRVLNSARVIYFLYKDEDGFTNSKAKTTDYIKSVLVDPIPI